jgi:hypothetical protein
MILKSRTQISKKKGPDSAKLLQFVRLIILQPLHCKPLHNATTSKMKSDICKALQKNSESDSFVTDSALHSPALYSPNGEHGHWSKVKRRGFCYATINTMDNHRSV